MNLSSIHPFPARMAPELARQPLAAVPIGGRVLDPMCGSGTVARAAVEAGLHCVGVDIDPLAVVMSRAWTTRIDPGSVCAAAETVVRTAKTLDARTIERAPDRDTAQFVGYWFGRAQKTALARVAAAIRVQSEPTKDLLVVALSRIIVSKEMMASLARDTSHSRPHRVATSNSFDVYGGFLRSAIHVAARLQPEKVRGQAEIRRGDARTLGDIDDGAFDLVLTSPPYLNAIDYIRGHRLALVWLGYDVASLRRTRAANVGAERGMSRTECGLDISRFVEERDGAAIAGRHLGWIRRYAFDMEAVLSQIRRVVKEKGQVAMVLGNSFIRGAAVDNAGLVEWLAGRVGLRLLRRQVREIPARRRYLPPPGRGGENALDARMRTETMLTFGVAA